jgi:uncharacterized protein with PQ loop repeat
MMDALDYTPFAATAFAVPQFLPQIRRLLATHDTAGVSWSWAALTSLNNAAWIAYFTLERYWTAVVPSSSATFLAGTLAVLLTLRGRPKPRPAVLVGAWAVMLITAYLAAGRAGLGVLLTAAFAVQVAPSIWTAYRTARPTGISSGTWLLIGGELSCWLTFGLYRSDPRLIALGVTGVTASTLMLARIRQASRRGPEPGDEYVLPALAAERLPAEAPLRADLVRSMSPKILAAGIASEHELLEVDRWLAPRTAGIPGIQEAHP